MKKGVRRNKKAKTPGKVRSAKRRPARASTIKQIEQRASRTERQLAVAQQITHIGSWEWNLGMNVVTWSDELYRMYGLEPQSCEITFEGFLSRVHQDDRARIQGAVSAAIEKRRPFGYRERIVRPDGSIRELDSLGEPAFDARGRFVGLIGTCRDVTEERGRERLEEGVHRTLEMIATVAPLTETLEALIRVIEAESDGMLASVLVYDPLRERLRVVASPSLPPAMNAELAEFPVGPDAASCGTAVYRRAAVIVSDILTDPLWKLYRHVAEKYGIRSSWSTPIFSNDGRVLGTFALYYRKPRVPSDRHTALIQRAIHIAGIAIERKQMEEQLVALTAHLERAREDERTGIAREIHDELGQALTGLKMDVAGLERAFVEPAPDLRDRLSAMSRLIDETINQVRRISSELRPGVLDHLGLVAALEWQAEEFQKRTTTRCVLHSSLEEIPLARDVSTGVFRIFQEALTNVARHAGATRVDIKLGKQGSRLHLEVADNGKGIREAAVRSPASLGLLGIRERARRMGGRVEVTGGKAGGTTLRLAVPLQPSDEVVRP